MDSAELRLRQRNFSSELNMFSEPRDGTGDSSYSSGLRVTYYVTKHFHGVGIKPTWSNPKKAFRNVSFHVVILGRDGSMNDGRMNVNRPITGKTDKPLGWL